MVQLIKQAFNKTLEFIGRQVARLVLPTATVLTIVRHVAIEVRVGSVKQVCHKPRKCSISALRSAGQIELF